MYVVGEPVFIQSELDSTYTKSLKGGVGHLDSSRQ